MPEKNVAFKLEVEELDAWKRAAARNGRSLAAHIKYLVRISLEAVDMVPGSGTEELPPIPEANGLEEL